MARATLRRRSNHLKGYLLAMQEHAVLAEEDLAAYLDLARQGSPDARQALIEGCLPMVVKWVAPRRGDGLEFDRLIEAGNLGLMEALEGLDSAAPLYGQLQAAVDAAVAKAKAPRRG